MKYIQHIITVMLVFATGITQAQEKVVINDPNAQVRNVGSFTEISVSSSIDLYLSNDDKETVVVSARDAYLRDRIITRINGNRLEIFFEYKGRMNWTDMRLKAYVSFKTLNKIRASGSSDVYVNGVIRSENLEIGLSGSSDFSGALDVKNLKLDQSGSSDSKISGRAAMVDIDLSGASDVKAFDLAVQQCKIGLSGSSDVSITCNGEMTVNASGASDVRYRGSGVIREVKTSGSSSVRRVE
jgi:Putative auto-transporter adhesin, head GIN domain